MTVTSLPTIAPTPTETVAAHWRDYQLGRLELASTFREAFYCAREARKHGADPDETIARLEAWAAERGLL